MNLVRYVLVNIVTTLLRFFPFPSKTGLIRIGNPGKNSPVLVTCNFHLTTERVKRELRGTDVYLLVANSRGTNVWCAATGGHFSSHDVISILKTSGIEELVNHRTVILPQLAATGVEAKTVLEKTGWKVIWGPVYAKHIAVFLENKLKKNSEMWEVTFPWTQQIEMAVAWAFPISVISVPIMLILWRSALPALIILIWVLSLSIFLSFPLYRRWLLSKKRRIGFITFDFSHGGLQLLLFGISTVGIGFYSAFSDSLTFQHILRWEIILLILVLVLTLDLSGSTSVYKGGKLEEKLNICIDESKCRGAGLCEQVCPKNCHAVSKEKHITTIPRADKCVQCGACIVQCPHDALFFKDTVGNMLLPETVRKFKLNLKGKRAVKVEE